jgi:hypothetical protein
MVEECNRAETGVGALMAKISHELKGNCADLENMTMHTDRTRAEDRLQAVPLRLTRWTENE